MKPTTGALILLATTGAVYLFLHNRKAMPAPTPAPAPAPAPTFRPGLDVNLSPEEAEAVSIALSIETLPANLKSFADSLSPDFPIAAAALRAKAST